MSSPPFLCLLLNINPLLVPEIAHRFQTMSRSSTITSEELEVALEVELGVLWPWEAPEVVRTLEGTQKMSPSWRNVEIVVGDGRRTEFWEH